MSLNRRDAKRDENEPEIVELYERLGFTVQRLSAPGVPDLLVGGEFSLTCPRCALEIWYKGNNLIEVKHGHKAHLTPEQIDFHAHWHGQIDIAHTMEEALEKVGRKAA